MTGAVVRRVLRPAGSPGLENVVLLRHLGWFGEAGFRQVYGQTVEDVAACREGLPIRALG